MDGQDICLWLHATLLLGTTWRSDPLTNEQRPAGQLLAPMETFSPPPRFRPNPKAPPLKTQAVESALSKCSPSSALGPDGILYSTWKQVNKITPSILLQTLTPLVTLRYHPGSLKGSYRVVLDKPGSPPTSRPPLSG